MIGPEIRALSAAAIIAALGYTPASTGAVLMADGSAAAPGMSFALELTTGFYRGATGKLDVAVQGTGVAEFNSSGIDMLIAGTAASPAFSVSNGVGFYSLTTYNIGGAALASLGLGPATVMGPGNSGDFGSLCFIKPQASLMWGPPLDGNSQVRQYCGSNPLIINSLNANANSTGQNGAISMMAWNNGSLTSASEPMLLIHKSNGTPGIAGGLNQFDTIGQFQWCGDYGPSPPMNPPPAWFFMNEYTKILAASYAVFCGATPFTDGFGTSVPGSHFFSVTPNLNLNPNNANLRGNASLTKIFECDSNMTISQYCQTHTSFGTTNFRITSGYGTNTANGWGIQGTGGAVTLNLENGTSTLTTNYSVAQVNFRGFNTTPAARTFAQIYCQADTNSAGTESSELWFGTFEGGTFIYGLKFGSATGGLIVGTTGNFQGDGTINCANGYYDSSVKLTSGGVIVGPINSTTNIISSNGVITSQVAGTASFFVKNTTAPGVAATIGNFNYTGLNASSATKNYVTLQGVISTATAGAEDGKLIIERLGGGANVVEMTIGGAAVSGVCVGGTPTPQGAGTLNAATAYYIANTQVVSARSTGWATQSASPAKTDLGASPTVGQIASYISALNAALITHGLIGA